ncbi:MAG: transposase, partial [Myxococcales bacterium]|nr:transposase [Myxococcales bacterium]
VLDGFMGDIQGDGYGGISSLFGEEGGPTRVGCNDHSRRKFVKALEQGDSRAKDVIDLYRVLYSIERGTREEELGLAAVLALRQEESVPIWERLESEVARLGSLVRKKSPLGKAIIYFERQKPTLCVFLGADWQWYYEKLGNDGLIYMDIDAYGGNSGGALVDASTGEVSGVVVREGIKALVDAGGVQSIEAQELDFIWNEGDYCYRPSVCGLASRLQITPALAKQTSSTSRQNARSSASSVGRRLSLRSVRLARDP